jgi:hypothetical protein
VVLLGGRDGRFHGWEAIRKNCGGQTGFSLLKNVLKYHWNLIREN